MIKIFNFFSVDTLYYLFSFPKLNAQYLSALLLLLVCIFEKELNYPSQEIMRPNPRGRYINFEYDSEEKTLLHVLLKKKHA